MWHQLKKIEPEAKIHSSYKKNDVPLHFRYCFIAPPPMVSSGNELSIVFNSDDFGRLKGFKATFTQSRTKGKYNGSLE